MYAVVQMSKQNGEIYTHAHVTAFNDFLNAEDFIRERFETVYNDCYFEDVIEDATYYEESYARVSLYDGGVWEWTICDVAYGAERSLL